MRRHRNAKIVATLGPATGNEATIAALRQLRRAQFAKCSN